MQLQLHTVNRFLLFKINAILYFSTSVQYGKINMVVIINIDDI